MITIDLVKGNIMVGGEFFFFNALQNKFWDKEIETAIFMDIGEYWRIRVATQNIC
jgi:hypothetical protein